MRTEKLTELVDPVMLTPTHSEPMLSPHTVNNVQIYAAASTKQRVCGLGERWVPGKDEYVDAIINENKEGTQPACCIQKGGGRLPFSSKRTGILTLNPRTGNWKDALSGIGSILSQGMNTQGSQTSGPPGSLQSDTNSGVVSGTRIGFSFYQSSQSSQPGNKGCLKNTLIQEKGAKGNRAEQKKGPCRRRNPSERDLGLTSLFLDI